MEKLLDIVLNTHHLKVIVLGSSCFTLTNEQQLLLLLARYLWPPAQEADTCHLPK